MNILREFVSKEIRKFDYKLGEDLASALSGFVAGAIVASMIWWVGIFLSTHL